MPLVGGNSGFKTVRDLLCFVIGLGLCIFHVVTTPSADLNIGFLMFALGIAGAPAVLRQDEKRDK